ncbi:MAG: hypothetical protein NC102_02255 [Clostridium sp.]|nr:hypothetical protein [Clostridium sp.]
MTRIEQQRAKLQKIEAAIRKIIGTDDPDSVFLWRKRKYPRVLERLEGLLLKRSGILNHMFQGTTEEMGHFDRINDHLLHLRNELFRRTTSMRDSISVDMDFDDDYEIEGTLMFSYDSAESVLTLTNDEFYGTDFQLMIKTLESYYFATEDENLGVVTIDPDKTNTADDGVSWGSHGVFGHDAFSNRIVGYGPYCLCYYKHFSIPDLVRLNDFWAEVTLTMQSMTTQSGERWIADKMKELRDESKV